MANAKKTFNKDLMYKKIMPTTNKSSNQVEVDKKENYNNDKTLQNDKDISEKETIIFHKKEMNFIKEERNDVILYNIMETLVLNKLDAILKKMNCCRCDRCKSDIVALSLNNLKPMYIVATKEEINNKIKELEKSGLEVTTAVLKSVLTVRKNPRH